MKVHKIVLQIIDFDHVGEEEIKDIIQHTKYPNRCISPKIRSFETVDIGEWEDDNPLNKQDTCDAEFERLFNKDKNEAIKNI